MWWRHLTLSNIAPFTLVMFMLVLLFMDDEEETDALHATAGHHRYLLLNSLDEYDDPKSTSLRGRTTARHVLEADHDLLASSNSKTQKDITSQQSSPSSKVKVSYVTSLSAEPMGSTTSSRRKEIEAALLVNVHNPNIDQIVVFLDGVSKESNCAHFFKSMKKLDGRHPFSQLSCIGLPGDPPTYYQMLQHTLNEAVTGDVVLLAKADQAFDNTISLAGSLNSEVLVVLGTRGFSNKMPTVTKYFYETVSVVPTTFCPSSPQ